MNFTRKNTQKTSVHIVTIADYNDDDAHGLVKDNLYSSLATQGLKTIAYDKVNVGAFNTLETGYILGRRALNPLNSLENQIFFVNTAPRQKNRAAKKTNEGEGFCFVKLKNGRLVFAVNSGFSLSFIKKDIDQFYHVNIPDNLADIAVLNSGDYSDLALHALGQFRSAYIYPLVVAQILKGDDTPLSDQFNTLLTIIEDWQAIIPDIPENKIVYIDGYGNIKATCKAPLSLDKNIQVNISHNDHNGALIAKAAHGIFAVDDGQTALSKGSSCFVYSDKSVVQLIEVVKRGGSARDAFLSPDTGQKIIPKIGWSLSF